MVSGIVLALVTILFAIALFIAEHSASPNYNFWDALVWTFVKYVEDPADIVSPPVTVFGQVIGTLVGVLGIAIFAIPAGLKSTVKDTVAYEALYEILSAAVADEFGLVCTPTSERYPLKKKNAAYHLQRKGLEGNFFVLRLSTQLVNFEENKLVVAMRIAQVVSQQLDDGKGIWADDVKDFATPAFGFAEKDEA